MPKMAHGVNPPHERGRLMKAEADNKKGDIEPRQRQHDDEAFAKTV